MDRFNMKNIRIIKIHCTDDNIVNKNKTPFDKTIYKSAIGYLIYLSKWIKSDITYSVNKVARKSEEPNILDWKKLINIFRYLNYTKDYKIL